MTPVLDAYQSLLSPQSVQPTLMQRFLYLMVHDMQQGIWVLDEQARSLFANAEMERILNCPALELTGRPLAEFLSPEDGAFFERLWRSQGELVGEHSALKDGMALRLLAVGGLGCRVKLRAQSLHDDQSQARHWVLLITDETARLAQEDALRQSEFVFRSQFEHGNIGMALTSPDKGWMRANAKLCEMLGYTEPELMAISWDVLTHPDDLELDLGYFQRLLAGDINGYELDKRFLRKDGSVVHTHLTVSSYRRVPGPYEYVIASLQDITDVKRSEAELRLAACVFASSQEGILIIDAAQHIIDLNPACVAVTGMTRAELLGQALDVALMAPGQDVLLRQRWQVLQSSGHWQGELDCRRASGEAFPVRMSIDAVPAEDGNVSQYACVFSDISQARLHERELDHIAHYDLLTGVPNRRLLSERLIEALAQARAGQDQLALCYIDLDGFKPINDQYGHQVGDEVLAEVAQRLSAHIRARQQTPDATARARLTDTVARLGGDEFVLLVGQLTNRAECQDLLQRLLEVIAQPLFVQSLEVSLQVSASIGVALFPEDDVDADSLLRHADQAMYRAKEAGKGCFRFFDVRGDMRMRSRRDMQALVARSLEGGELSMFYQPKVDMRKGVVVGVEALLRWQDPQLGLRLPGSFLPALYDSELDVRLGRWVIAQCMAQMSRWAEQGHVLQVSINISAGQLQSPGFVEDLKNSLLAHPWCRRRRSC